MWRFSLNCFDSMGSRHFPTEQLWLGKNPGVFRTEYLWDWQVWGISFAFFCLKSVQCTIYIRPPPLSVCVRVRVCLYFNEPCFVLRSGSTTITLYNQYLEKKKKCCLSFSFARDAFYLVLRKGVSILKSLHVKATTLSFYME